MRLFTMQQYYLSIGIYLYALEMEMNDILSETGMLHGKVSPKYDAYICNLYMTHM